MANTLGNTALKVKDAVSAVINGVKPINVGRRGTDGLQTPLEMFGMQIRASQITGNTYGRCLQYTKALVDAEYMVQQEFPVSSYKDDMIEDNKEKELKKQERIRDKAQNKIDKINSKKTKEKLK